MELIYRRAGCPPDSQQIKDLLTALSKSDAVETFGFYSRMLLPLLLLTRFLDPRRTNMTDRVAADEQTSDNRTLPEH